MSRIGKKPVIIPANVTVNVAEGNVVTVKGPKGELTNTFNADMIINVEGNVLTVSRPTDEANHRALHGLTRTLIANMVEGVDKGYSKELEVNGVGYRAEKKGNQLVMRLGYSHEVFMDEIPGITVEVNGNKITVKGIDKQAVGQSLDAAVINVAAAVENDLFNALLQGALCNQSADLLCSLDIAAVAFEALFHRGGGDQGAACDIVNDLRIDVVLTAEHAQPGTLGRTRDLAAYSAVTLHALCARIGSVNHSGTPPFTWHRSCLLCGGQLRSHT